VISVVLPGVLGQGGGKNLATADVRSMRERLENRRHVGFGEIGGRETMEGHRGNMADSDGFANPRHAGDCVVDLMIGSDLPRPAELGDARQQSGACAVGP